MKTHQSVSSQRRKSRKAHFSAPSSIRRKIMSSHLNKELRTKYDVRSIPVRKGDVVKVMRGTGKGREGKVLTVYRKKWAVHVEKLTKEKSNGTQVQIPVHASNLLITQLKIDKNRKAILERKKRVTKEKNKHKEGLAGLD
ncbi:60s ribosomal protein l26 [Stylonychia lemnae]|uniref:60s ribosomal protein l26 n=1 Tax=Stylonychia lemnae TaxID=5949 RepID=A0A077ZRL3_STYLE|nr:60s ribosomal protein l26 [Stylonychia lemnae]|eukprot:CDW71975.1 60s ribosomal protein l26 [Stylonychia lemnae]